MTTLVKKEKLLKASIQHIGDYCGAPFMGDKCEHFIYLSDPVAGPAYIGLCGLFNKYLKLARSAHPKRDGLPKIARCYKCRKTFKDVQT